MNKLNQKGIAHLIILVILMVLVLGLVAGVYLVQNTQIFKPKAEDLTNKSSVNQTQVEVDVKPDPVIESLGNELLQLDQKYDQEVNPTPRTSPSSQVNPNVKGEETSAVARAQLNKMIDVAQKREEILIKKLEENPREFLVNANLADKRDSLPQEVKEHVEEKIQGNGQLILLHQHLEDNKSKDEYYVELGKGSQSERYRIYFSETNSGLSPQANVSIHSITIDDKTAITNIDNQTAKKVLGVKSQGSVLSAGVTPVGTLQILSLAPDQKFINPKIAVMLVKFAELDEPNFTQEDIQEIVNTRDDSIKKFIEQASYGQSSMQADVLGWTTLSTTASCGGITEVMKQVNQAVGVDKLSSYDKKMYLLQSSPCLHSSGGAHVRGDNAFLIASHGFTGTTESVEQKYYEGIMYTFTHELLHTFGLAHANFLNCHGKSIDTNPSVNCDDWEYGDSADLMGARLVGLNAPHKVQLGWGSQRVQEVTTAGTYKISFLESVSPGIQILKIRKADTNGNYYISYRQPVGLGYITSPIGDYSNEINLLSNFFKGASIHFWGEPLYNNGSQNNFDPTHLITVNPTPFNAYTAPLSDNATFTDNLNGITIKQISHDNTSVTLDVTFGAAFNTPNVTVALIPRVNQGKAIQGNKLQFRATVKNVSGSAKVENLKTTFELDINSDNFSQVDLAIGNPTIASLNPGETQDVISDIWNNIPAGKHTLRACTNKPQSFTEYKDDDNCKDFTFNVVDSSYQDLSRVFLTSKTYTGDLRTAGSGSTGLQGADNICQQLADSSTAFPDLKNSKWKAWLSDKDVSVTQRLRSQGKVLYTMVDGVSVIASSWEDLTDGSINRLINLDKNGEEVYDPRRTTWTGTDANGLIKRLSGSVFSCNNWTNGENDFSGWAGTLSIQHLNSKYWTDWTDEKCDTTKYLYCFEDPKEISGASSSPSPSPSGGTGVYTVSYKVGETPADLVTAIETPYTKEPLGFDYVFKNPALGAKFLWVEFKDSVGGLATRSAQIDVVASSASPSASPSVSPSPSPSPSPSAPPVVPPPPPAGGGGGGGSGGGGGGGGGGGSSTVTPSGRTIKEFRFAEDPTALQSAQWKTYGQGIVVKHILDKFVPGKPSFIFIQFRDGNEKIVQINGQEYISTSIDIEGAQGGTDESSNSVSSTAPEPATNPTTSDQQVTIGTATLSTPFVVAGSSGNWNPVSINLNLSGFSSPGRSIVGLFVRNSVGECSIHDCGYDRWTQIRSYGTNGTDSIPWTASDSFASGDHMFAIFTLNSDGTAGQLLAVSKTNFGGTPSSGGNIVNCIPKETACTCGGTDPLQDDYAGVCKIYTGGCNGGWCNGGVCETCSQ